MKTKRSFKFPMMIALLSASCAFVSVAQAAPKKTDKAPKTPAPKVTTETSFIGPATEQVVVTEKYKDGTVIRVVQIIHTDGTTETSGVRQAPAGKS